MMGAGSKPSAIAYERPMVLLLVAIVRHSSAKYVIGDTSPDDARRLLLGGFAHENGDEIVMHALLRP